MKICYEFLNFKIELKTHFVPLERTDSHTFPSPTPNKTTDVSFAIQTYSKYLALVGKCQAFPKIILVS